MAESAISFLLSQLTLLLPKEIDMLPNIREEIEYITDELERIRAFLRDSDPNEECDSRLQLWVKQVYDVAYDTEDVLDEFMLFFACNHRMGFYNLFHKIFCSIKTFRTRHHIASRVRKIKSKVSSITEGHNRYAYKINTTSKQGSSSSKPGSRMWCDRQGDALLLEDAELVGIQKPKKQLIDWLLDANANSSRKTVSVVGMGGLGKTTLVKKVYDDVEFKSLFQSHAWLTVSQYYNITDLLKDLIRQLFGEIRQRVPQRLEHMDNNRLRAVIKDFLQERHYLLVLDEVWSIDAWEAIKYALPDKNGSCVAITTRKLDVASSASGVEPHGNIFTMKALSPEESWTLFCRKTFQGNCCPPYLEKLSESILRKCQGLPLAIVAISGVLASKDKSRTDEWEMVHRSLRTELESNNTLRSTMKVLLLSFEDLPYYLKFCFLYLSIFPEDHLIEKMRLIRLWIAEGFVEATEGLTQEEVGEKYLSELINRSLIQVVGTTTDGRVKTCRIHDLLLDIILSKSKGHNFAAIASGETVMVPEKVRRLSIHSSLGRVQASQRFCRLRSLLMFGVKDPVSKLSVPTIFNGGSRLLKILDMRGASLETIPDGVFKLLNLRYLSLRNTKVKCLPNSIGNLQHLETLDLKGTYVTELPADIRKLQKLRHLLIYRHIIELYAPFHSISGFSSSARLGDLSSLQKLSCLELNLHKGSLTRELVKLTQLRRLSILKLRSEDGSALCFSIEKMSQLRSLSITSIEEDQIIDLELLSSAPPLLQRLYLTGPLERLPHWISSLHSLVRLSLRWSCLRNDPLESLQNLPNLLYLTLLQVHDGETMCFNSGGFQKLKVLLLVRLKELKSVKIENGAMPHIEELYIRNCKKLEMVPEGIEHLRSLRVIEFGDMPDRLISRLRRDTQGEDYWRIASIPKIWVGYKENNSWTGYHLV